MTMRFSANNNIEAGTTSPQQGPNIIYEFLNFMRTASPGGPGWTLKSGYNDSGGTTFNGPSDLDGYVANNTPWFVLQDPSGNREVLVCRESGADQQEWRFYYSPSAGFTGGASGTLPTATDQGLIGGGAGAEICNTGLTINQYAQYGADDAEPYGFFFFIYEVPLLRANGGFAMVPIDVEAPNETDPVVFMFAEFGAAFNYESISRCIDLSSNPTVAKCAGIIPGTSTFESIAAMCLCDTFSGGVATMYRRVPGSSGYDSDSNDNPIPITFLRQSGVTPPHGYKGVSTFAQWRPNPRNNISTYKSLTQIQIGDVLFPWDGVTVPAV